MNFNVIKSDMVYNGKVFDLKVDQIEYIESGNKGIRETAIHPGGAAVVAVTGNKFLFVKQFRYPLNKVLLEIPAGKLNKGENPDLCAAREFEEETGFYSEDMVKLGKISSSPGFCDEIIHIYLAKNLKAGKVNREEGEQGMEVIYLTIDEINEKIKNGEIIDAKTISGIYMALNYIKNN